jgi:hypothetical protein
MTSCVHKKCERTYGQTNMKRAMTLAKINHLWNRYNMRMLISWLTKIPNMNKMRQKNKWLVAYTRCANGRMVKQTWKGQSILQKSTIREIGIIYACSDHTQSRYQVWIKCDNRQMTSCVHKMWERTYGQTNIKRAMTLAKINHTWNRENMCMLKLWPTKIPNMNKMRQKTND